MNKWSSIIKLAALVVVWFATVWAGCTYVGVWLGWTLVAALAVQAIGSHKGWWRDRIGEFLNK